MLQFILPWPLAPDQRWRWRHPRLWRGRAFAPHDPSRVMAYAVLQLPPTTRDVFLLSQIKALDYELIARHLDLSVAEVQALLAAAFCEIACTVALIERVRPKATRRPDKEQPNV